MKTTRRIQDCCEAGAVDVDMTDGSYPHKARRKNWTAKESVIAGLSFLHSKHHGQMTYPSDTYSWTSRVILLLQEEGKRNEEDQGDDVAVDGEDHLTDPHIKGRPGDDMEAGVAKLQGQHGHVQLRPLRHAAHLPRVHIRHLSHHRRDEGMKRWNERRSSGEGGLIYERRGGRRVQIGVVVWPVYCADSVNPERGKMMMMITASHFGRPESGELNFWHGGPLASHSQSPPAMRSKRAALFLAADPSGSVRFLL
ncbi:hypothetical protein GW17_00053845 [Ensete ventricosum]|nr:hypothetical protein GW17_00053845 [Ensete ventricosum]